MLAFLAILCLIWIGYWSFAYWRDKDAHSPIYVSADECADCGVGAAGGAGNSAHAGHGSQSSQSSNATYSGGSGSGSGGAAGSGVAGVIQVELALVVLAPLVMVRAVTVREARERVDSRDRPIPESERLNLVWFLCSQHRPKQRLMI